MAKPLQVDDILMARILERVNGLEYGSVLITVHDGKIVQIDRTERRRYNDADPSPAGLRGQREDASASQ